MVIGKAAVEFAGVIVDIERQPLGGCRLAERVEVARGFEDMVERVEPRCAETARADEALSARLRRGEGCGPFALVEIRVARHRLQPIVLEQLRISGGVAAADQIACPRCCDNRSPKSASGPTRAARDRVWHRRAWRTRVSGVRISRRRAACPIRRERECRRGCWRRHRSGSRFFSRLEGRGTARLRAPSCVRHGRGRRRPGGERRRYHQERCNVATLHNPVPFSLLFSFARRQRRPCI